MDKVVNYKSVLNFFKEKKVLITGHTGFKGSWLSTMLDYYGVQVLGYSLSPQSKPSIFSQVDYSKNFTSVISNINNKKKFSKYVKEFNPDIIFHLAAQPLVLESYNNPYLTHTTNYSGTLNLLEILRENKSKSNVVFITTDKVYRNNDNLKAFKEDDPLGGFDPYSSSKAASEILIKSYYDSFFKNHKIGIATARAGNVIGGGDWSDNRLIPDIMRYKYNSQDLLIRNLEAIRPWQHVLEPLFGYLLLAKNLILNPIQYSQAWNFGPSPENFKSVKDIIIQLGIQKLNNGNSSIQKKEAENLILDSSKSEKSLNWRSKWDFEKTIEKTDNWYANYYTKKENVKDLIVKDLENYI